MIITDIVQAKKDRERAHIYGDGKYVGTLYLDQILDYHLKINDEITPDEFGKILSDSINKKLFNLCLNFISRRQRSEKEIVDYINKKIYTYKYEKDAVDINQIIDKLKYYNYINDQSFAKLWMDSRIKKGIGPRRIRLELAQKGVEKEIINEVIPEINEEDKDIAIEKLTKKYLRKHIFKNESEKKWKLKQYLMSKGF